MVITNRQLQHAQKANVRRLAAFMGIHQCPDWDLVPTVSLALAMTWLPPREQF